MSRRSLLTRELLPRGSVELALIGAFLLGVIGAAVWLGVRVVIEGRPRSPIEPAPARGPRGEPALPGPPERPEPARGPGSLPPEVEAAIAGRAVTPRPLPSEVPLLERAVELRPSGPPGARADDAGDPASLGPGGSAVPGDERATRAPTPEERAQRAKWRDAQARRDAHRLDVLGAALALGPAQREAAAAAFAESLAAKVALYDRLDPADPDRGALSSGLAAIRARLDASLGAALGPDGLATYHRLDAEGGFALPEEMRKPPR